MATGRSKAKMPAKEWPNPDPGPNRMKSSRSGAKQPTTRAEKMRQVRRKGSAAAAWANVKGTLTLWRGGHHFWRPGQLSGKSRGFVVQVIHGNLNTDT